MESGDFISYSFRVVCFHSLVSVSDPDPYHLVGSGSVSGNVDMDPGSAKN